MMVESVSGNPRCSILVVDANSDSRKQLLRTLESADFLVRSAATGFEAFNLLYGLSFDLVLLDLDVPELSGVELLSLAAKEGILPRCVLLRKGPPSGHAVVTRLPNVIGVLPKTMYETVVDDVRNFLSSHSDHLFKAELAGRRFRQILEGRNVPKCAIPTLTEAFFHGGTQRTIASRLGFAEVTVRNHLRRASRAIGGDSVTESLERLERELFAPSDQFDTRNGSKTTTPRRP